MQYFKKYTAQNALNYHMQSENRNRILPNKIQDSGFLQTFGKNDKSEQTHMNHHGLHEQKQKYRQRLFANKKCQPKYQNRRGNSNYISL